MRLPRLRRPARVLTLVVALVVAAGVVTVVDHGRTSEGRVLTQASYAARPTLQHRRTTSAGPKHPNIVEVLVDDMRQDDLAYMPHLEQLIGDHGITMENGFSSYPLCCPARASFFSGELPHNHHVWSVTKPYAYPAFNDRSTIATSLQKAGYLTGLTGKYLNEYGQPTHVAGDGGSHLARVPVKVHVPGRGRHGHGRTRTVWRWRLVPIKPGQKVASAYKVPLGWDEWHGFIQPQGKITDPVTGQRVTGGTYKFFHAAENDNGHPRTLHRGEYSSHLVADEARKMISEFHRRHKPFFISANFVAPHVGEGNVAETQRDQAEGVDSSDTTAAPASFRGMFDSVITRPAGMLADGTTEADANGDGQDTTADTADKPGDWGDLPPLDGTETAKVLAATRQRAESLAATDDEIARIVARLKSTHTWRNTVFVFWSDNGYMLGEHHRPKGKIVAYNPSMRVPYLFTGPGMRHARNSYDPIDVVDLTATLLDFAGARPPHPSDGRSLKDTLLGEDHGWQYAEPYEEGVMMPVSAPGRRAPGHDKAVAQLPRVPQKKVWKFRLVHHANAQMGQGVRTARYLYVRYADGFEELYDERSDPLEMSNVADDPAYAKIKAQLHAASVALYACRGPKPARQGGCSYRLPWTLAMSPSGNAEAGLNWWNASYGAYANSLQAAYWSHQSAAPTTVR